MDAEDIKDFADMMGIAFNAGLSFVTDPPAHLSEFIKAERIVQGPVDADRASYAQYALAKLTNVGTTIGTFPKVKFVSTLNKASELVEFNQGPILLIDDYLFQTLEDLSHLFLRASAPVERGAFALRLLAERFLVNDRKPLATHAAISHSVLINTHKIVEPAPPGEDGERIDSVQLVFLLAHEVAHILWAKGKQPADFNEQAAEWIAQDARMTTALGFGGPEAIAEKLAGGFAQNPSVEALRAIAGIVASNRQKFDASHSQARIEANHARRSVPNSPFIEEVWADFYAWTSCMRLFFGNWPATTVYRGMCLGLINLASVDAMHRLAENTGRWDVADDMGARRRVLRFAMMEFVNEVRSNEAFREHVGLRERRISQSTL